VGTSQRPRGPVRPDDREVVPKGAVVRGQGFADLLRTNSIYRRLDSQVREELLDAIAERLRTQLGDRVSRRYLSVLRAGQPAA
jgi:hypothetical protein